jgi:hypothetical protein
VPSL